MKTEINTGLRGFLAVAIVTAALLTNLTAPAQEKMKPMKGGEHQMMLNKIETEAEAEALKPGDSIAMACAKCKSVSVTRVEKESKGHVTRLIPGEKHLCPGCGGTIEVVGHGKGKKDVRHHTCSKCGDDSAFCCATKPGSGPTRGMEKK